MINKLLARVQKVLIPGPARPPTGDLATDTDIYYCYRLLLNREPDPMGLAFWQDLIHTHQIPVSVLSEAFLNSHEAKELQTARNEPQLVELPDFDLYVRPNDFFIGMAIARDHIYEPYVMSEMLQWLKPGKVFVDVGANIGYFTLLAASRVGSQGKVHAFEPRPDNCALIQRSITANDFQNVELYPFAVAEKAQTFSFTSGGPDSNGRLVRDEELEGQPFSVPEVEAVTLDEMLGDLERVDLLKMDIEGAEPRAWQGMQQILNRHRPVLIFEFSPSLIRTTSQVEPEQFLEKVKSLYRLHILQRSGEKSAAVGVQEIMAAQARSGLTHLDLVGYPRDTDNQG